MKLIYITNTRLPSEKANSYQSVQMCNSFASEFEEVELWTGKAHNTKEMLQIDNIFEFYNIEQNFLIKTFFQLDSIVLRNLNQFIWANLRDLVFSVNISINLIKYRNKPETILYTRVWHFLYIFLFFQKLGMVKNKIFYESHQYSKYHLKVLKKIDGVVVINQNLSLLYKKRGINKIIVAHDGVNMSTFKFEEKSAFNPPEFDKFKNKKVITYIGSYKTLGAEKGIADIIKSIPFLNDQEICFAFIGGPMKYVNEYLNLSESLKINRERLIFIDRQPIANLKFYMRQSKALLMPFPNTQHYAYYMSPLKMFEYMTSKVPIIASKLPSILEVLKDKENAIICEPDNPNDIADKIQYVIENDCSKIAKKALEDVAEFTWEKRANKVQKFITSEY